MARDAAGTVLAFMMAITAISFPEMVILRKVLKVKLLVIFAAIMTVAIIMVGYLLMQLSEVKEESYGRYLLCGRKQPDDHLVRRGVKCRTDDQPDRRGIER